MAKAVYLDLQDLPDRKDHKATVVRPVRPDLKDRVVNQERPAHLVSRHLFISEFEFII